METIISAAITGILTLCGVIVTTMQSGRKIQRQLESHQSVTDCKIEELTREVREHNHFAQRMPVVEEALRSVNEKIRYLHRDEF